ncbi:hypothetical protein [Candidatus Odyssella thessalonicensis]|uniref:hypothetical protein n=1 Tax=Candidatus Odyssella thessalonicensis TaxID=84647 RepID=UPI00031213A0|nr:hypothetical protein [Candidatus Odyssella thessalonicensis]
MLNYGYILRHADRRLLLAALVFATLWAGARLYNTTEQQLHLLQSQYPLHQQWQLAQQCQDVAWQKVKEGAAWAPGRLKTIFNYMVSQFGVSVDQIKVEEATFKGELKVYKIYSVVRAATDAEILEFLHYLERELFPLVAIEKFSLHRSRTLDESMLQEGQGIHLVEGRINIAWISK